MGVTRNRGEKAAESTEFGTFGTDFFTDGLAGI